MIALDFGHIAESLLTTTVPIFIILWKNKMAAKKENQKKHQENLDSLKEINDTMKDHPPHHHIEKQGPLMASGIRPDIT